MRVVTSCFTRFHIVEQARQLQRLNMLCSLITGVPSRMLSNSGLDRKRIDSIPSMLMLSYALRKAQYLLPPRMMSRLQRATHDVFSAQVARRLPACDVFIGLSAYSYDAILEAKARGVRTIIDHGSLHEKTDKEVVLEEQNTLGIKLCGNSNYEWLIEKEDREFEVADNVIVLSNVAKRSMVRHGVDAEKIFVNSCGVRLDRFSPKGKKDSIFRIIHCSNLSGRKGIYYLVRAFRELQIRDAELWLIGSLSAMQSDRRYAELISGYCTKQVVFKGEFKQDQLADIFSQGSVFVMPSLSDGFGMVVTQAMACGLPVIVSSMTGAADLITEGSNGFVFPSRNIDVLKEKLLFLYRNRDVCREMGEGARLTVATAHTWDHYGNRLGAFLNEIN